MTAALLGARAQTASLRNGTTSHVSTYTTYAFGFGPAATVISAKPHAPFSAVVVEQMEQTLNDGTSITRDRKS